MESQINIEKVNGVNGDHDSIVVPSLGKVPWPNGHMQVEPDRHPVTARNRNQNNVFKVATWNVRTLFQTGKLENVRQEMKNLGVNILGISEVRWTGVGRITEEGKDFIYAGGDKHEHGVGIMFDEKTTSCILGFWAISKRVIIAKLKGEPFNINFIQVYAPTATSDNEEIEQFYEEVKKAKKQCKSQ